MATNEKLDKLIAAREKAEAELHKAQLKMKQVEREVSKETDRQRTHRLCTRAGHLESKLEDPELLTDEDVCKLIDFIFTLEPVTSLVREMFKVRRGEVNVTVDELIGTVTAKQQRRASFGAVPTVTSN